MEQMIGADGDRSLRYYYDPSGELNDDTDEIFFDKVAKSRAEIELVGGPSISGYEVVVAETYHAGLLLPQAVVNEFSKEQLSSNLEDLEAHTKKMVGKVGLIAEKYSQKAKIEKYYEPIMISRVIATYAHDSQRRKNGNVPYISHPNNVAAITLAGYGEYATQNPADVRMLARLAIDYGHDSDEDTRKQDGSHLGRSVLATPRMFQRALMAYDFPLANTVARTIRTLSHHDGITHKVPYGTYIDHGLDDTKAEFEVPKTSDVLHNSRFDAEKYSGSDRAKIDKITNKQLRYDHTLAKIAEMIKNRDTTGMAPGSKAWLIDNMINHVDEEKIQAAHDTVPYLPEHLDLAA